MTETNIIVEYNVPIVEYPTQTVEGEDFKIKGIAINETTTSNGHKFIGEELKTAAQSLVGVPLLKDHENIVDNIVGRVVNSSYNEIDKNIQFEAKIMDAKMREMIADGRLNTVSVGAAVRELEENDDGELIPRGIQFKELSLVAIPADPGAAFQIALQNSYSNKCKTTVKGGLNMAEEQQEVPQEEPKEESKEESQEESKEEPKEESEDKSEDKSETSEAVEKMRSEIVKLTEQIQKLQVKQSDEDEAKAEEPKEEPKEDAEEESEEDDEVDESGKVAFVESYGALKGKALTVQRKLR